MRIKYTKNAAEDIAYRKTKDKKIYKRFCILIHDIEKNPFILHPYLNYPCEVAIIMVVE